MFAVLGKMLLVNLDYYTIKFSLASHELLGWANSFQKQLTYHINACIL